MLYFCLSKHSYIRCTDTYVYIANKSSGYQLIYDSNSREFVSMLTHTPQNFDEVVEKLFLCFEDTDKKEIYDDFLDFLKNLKKEGFILLEETISQIEKNNNEDIILKLDIPPITDLTIELTNRCNERCVHCYLPNQLKQTGKTMSSDTIKSLVDQFVRMGGKTITLTGGEVLLHNELINILHYINNNNLQIIIYSNLILLSDEIIKTLSSTCIQCIQVSLYSINPVIHDSITCVKGSCNRTKRSIEALKRAGLPIRIACPVMKENMHDIINILEYAKKLNIHIDLEFNITPQINKCKDNLAHRITIEEMEVLFNKLMDYDSEFFSNFFHIHKHKYDKNFNLAEYLNYPVCTAGHYGLYVTVEGKVSTCPNLQDNSVDDIFTSTLESIWYNNNQINKLRQTTESSFIKCINCEASDYCFRCFARNYTETGNIMECPEYACKMAFLAKKIVENRKMKYLC